MAVPRLKMTARRLSDVAGYDHTSHYPLVFCLPLMVGLFVVFGCGNRCVPELVLIPMSPWLTGYWALLILQVAWLLGYTASQGYLPAFATSTSTPRTRGG
jgi:hypothetical protein